MAIELRGRQEFTNNNGLGLICVSHKSVLKVKYMRPHWLFKEMGISDNLVPTFLALVKRKKRKLRMGEVRK